MIATVLSWVTFGVAIAALVVGILSMVIKRKVIQKEIVFEDEAVKLKNGVIFAKGFSNEQYKTNKQPTIIKEEQIRAFKFSDGMSQMSEGNLDVSKNISCQRFSDGTLNIQDGSLTTTGSVIADHFTATRSFDVPAENYANMYVLEMQEVNFSNIQEWKPIAANTKATQWFFPGFADLHHGVTIGKQNKVQLQKRGKWRYQFNLFVLVQGQCVVAASFDNQPPKLANGYGRGRDQILIHGFGVVDVTDTETSYKLFFQHLQEPTSGEYGLQLQDGHVLLHYMGR